MFTFRLISALLLLTSILPIRVSAQISIAESVLTQKNNVQRTGVYDHETVLTPAIVSGGQFRKRCVRQVEGQVVAQPLYVKGVTIGGVRKNVLYVVTRKNFIYAFDADNVNQLDPRKGQVWANPIELVDWDPPGSRSRPLKAGPLKGMLDRCHQTFGSVGITSTPVIDPKSQVMYLVARFGTSSGVLTGDGPPYHYLVSIDIRTGQELKRIKITTPASSPTAFESGAELNRPGLLLLNSVLYIAFGAPVCDQGEDNDRKHSHGWVFAYSVPAMQYLDSYNTSPSGALASIWQSGNGLAADPARGFVYAFTGNNDNPDRLAHNQTGNGRDDLYHPSRTDLGESILKFRLGSNSKFLYDPSYTNPVVEHFTAGNWYRLDSGYHCPAEETNGTCPPASPGSAALHNPIPGVPENDSDLGSGAPVVLSNGFVVGGGKQGRMYVLDPINSTSIRTARQGFFAALNTWHIGAVTTCNTNNPAGVNCAISPNDYDVAQDWGPNIHGGPAVWERPGQPYGYLYLMGEKDYLRSYRVSQGGHVAETAEFTSKSSEGPNRPPMRAPDGMPGGAVSVSSNGNQNGIVWVSFSPRDASYSIQSGVLMAFDALTLKLLWFDSDPLISYAKFVPPTIAGGKVYRASFGDHNDGGCTVEAGNKSCGSIVFYDAGPDLKKVITEPPRQLSNQK